jgi:hypothetical protein
VARVELKGDDRIHRRDEKGMKAEGVGDETGKCKAESGNGESGNDRFPIVSSPDFGFSQSAAT